MQKYATALLKQVNVWKKYENNSSYHYIEMTDLVFVLLKCMLQW